MNEALDAATRAGNPAEGGLLARTRRFAGMLLEHIATRGELLAVEIAEEKQRLVQMVIACGILLVAAAMVLVFAGIWVLVLAWNTTHRELVAGLIPIVFLVVAAGAWFWLKGLIGRRSTLFKDSLRELRQDGQALRG
ncbi:MAG: phage holin family protein [Betaproteobacteria bacterium]